MIVTWYLPRLHDVTVYVVFTAPTTQMQIAMSTRVTLIIFINGRDSPPDTYHASH
jgi:hypothetical protein